jgi:hypothetical protein
MISVIKASGEKEPFDETKLVRSLVTSGLSASAATQTVDYISRNLKPVNSTTEIHDHVVSYLRENAPTDAYFNYGLKRAIMDLGPSGHPFEIIVSDILRLDGHKTEVAVVTLGKCVTHEIDVIAYKNSQQFFIECKFHNGPGVKTDIQVALYSYARFLDIESAMKQKGQDTQYFSWLFTNTKVTTEVLDYARCVGLKITSWLDPKGMGLHELIIKSGLHPVTLLRYLPNNKIHQLIDRGIVTCHRLEKAIASDTISDILTKDEIREITKDISGIHTINE